MTDESILKSATVKIKSSFGNNKKITTTKTLNFQESVSEHTRKKEEKRIRRRLERTIEPDIFCSKCGKRSTYPCFMRGEFWDEWCFFGSDKEILNGLDVPCHSKEVPSLRQEDTSKCDVVTP